MSNQENKTVKKAVKHTKPAIPATIWTFHFECCEYPNAEMEGNHEDMEHHIEIKVGPRFRGHPFIEAIIEHEEAFPRHVMNSVSLGDVSDDVSAEKKENPMVGLIEP